MNKTINVDETVKEMFEQAKIHESWEQKMNFTDSEFLRFVLEYCYSKKVFDFKSNKGFRKYAFRKVKK